VFTSAGGGGGSGSGGVVAAVAGLDDAALVERFRELDEQVRRAEAELAAVVAEVDRRGLHGADGHVSMRGWLRATGNWSGEEIRARLRTAALVAEAPQVADRLSGGDAGVAHVRELSRAHANPRCGRQLVEVLEVLIGHASGLPFDDFKLCVRRWELLADADGAWRDHHSAEAARDASVEFVGAEVVVAANGSVEAGRMMREVFDAFRRAEFLADAAAATAAGTKDLARSEAQRRFDALAAIFNAAATAPLDGVAFEAVVNYVIDQATFDEHLTAMITGVPPGAPDPASVLTRRCETLDGDLVHPREVIAAALIGHVRRVVYDSRGVVINLGRQSRLFTGAARDAIRLQDAHCTTAGCRIRGRDCQADHIEEWSRGGATDADNGRMACGHHNRGKNHGFTTRRDDGGRWHTYRPDGTEIE
jgi:hypothetical protein